MIGWALLFAAFGVLHVAAFLAGAHVGMLLVGLACFWLTGRILSGEVV